MKASITTISVVAVFSLSDCVCAFGQPQTDAYISPLEIGPSSAIDAKGVRHRGEDYPNALSPWQHDIIKSVAPDYSYDDRLRRRQGTGVFKLILDLKTGTVRSVSIIRSTGFSTLDNSAVSALSHWRWKPGKWREIEIPVRFNISRTFSHPPGSIPLPRS